ncbi:MAG TPA: hypothetical protein VIV11_15140 [Kofleriaceae bacterium]
MRKSVLSTLCVLLLSSVALADQKSDAQAKVDATKTETCEKVKKFIADQHAKGKCKTEHEEAQKITCSAQTFTKMNELNTKCVQAKPTADKPADKPAEGTPKCRALEVADSKTVIAEAEDKLSTKCVRLLTDALQKKWCTAENKGKKFDYLTDYDHTIGTGKFAKKIQGKKQTWTCRTVAK